MFNAELEAKLEKLTNAVQELVSVNRAIVVKLESQNKSWAILADHVGKLDNPDKAAFSVTR